jgi:hypothetical protein
VPFPNGTVTGVPLRFLRRLRRLAIGWPLVGAASDLLLELNGSFNTTQTDASVATTRVIPRGDNRELILEV